jgi:uncharacterized protein YegL
MLTNKTEIVCIVDRSGSMRSFVDDTIGGFNEFLGNQREEPGEAQLTLVLFDHEYTVVHDGVPLMNVPPLDRKTYRVRGQTALHDAIGRAIQTVGTRLANTPDQERPDKVLVMILTDGQENASVEYGHQQVRDLIERQRDKYSWEFVYLGANQDSFAVAQGLAVPQSANFDASGKGVRRAYKSMGLAASRCRRGKGAKLDSDDVS